jgi:hypothetical protein
VNAIDRVMRGARQSFQIIGPYSRNRHSNIGRWSVRAGLAHRSLLSELTMPPARRWRSLNTMTWSRFPADRTDQPFSISILPRGARRRRSIPDNYRSVSADKRHARLLLQSSP